MIHEYITSSFDPGETLGYCVGNPFQRPPCIYALGCIVIGKTTTASTIVDKIHVLLQNPSFSTSSIVLVEEQPSQNTKTCMMEASIASYYNGKGSHHTPIKPSTFHLLPKKIQSYFSLPHGHDLKKQRAAEMMKDILDANIFCHHTRQFEPLTRDRLYAKQYRCTTPNKALLWDTLQQYNRYHDLADALLQFLWFAYEGRTLENVKHQLTLSKLKEQTSVSRPQIQRFYHSNTRLHASLHAHKKRLVDNAKADDKKRYLLYKPTYYHHLSNTKVKNVPSTKKRIHKKNTVALIKKHAYTIV